jgi:hypothetical protein
VSELGDSLRVSDAERDVTLKTLNDNAAVGRLTLDELEERAGYRLSKTAFRVTKIFSADETTGKMGASL